MISDQETFPRRLKLYHGAILGTIAHAIWVASNPYFSHEQSWDGLNYSVQDSMGSRGTISFTGDQVVGVFFDKNSIRNPFRSSQHYDLHSFFVGMPQYLLSFAKNEALQYMLQEYEGTVKPIITAAFWSKGEYLTAMEPWTQVFDHGAHLISIQLQDIEVAIREWQVAYEMSSSQVSVMKSLFDRKMASPNHHILLSEREKDIMVTKDAEGLEESQELLAAIGITLPY